MKTAAYKSSLHFTIRPDYELQLYIVNAVSSQAFTLAQYYSALQPLMDWLAVRSH